MKPPRKSGNPATENSAEKRNRGRPAKPSTLERRESDRLFAEALSSVSDEQLQRFARFTHINNSVLAGFQQLKTEKRRGVAKVVLAKSQGRKIAADAKREYSRKVAEQIAQDIKKYGWHNHTDRWIALSLITKGDQRSERQLRHHIANARKLAVST